MLGLVTLATLPLLGGAYTAWSGTGGLALLLRLAVAALALLPADDAHGRNAARSSRHGSAATDARAAWLGWCYAANTVGGVAGSLLAGFYLLRVHDAYVATFVAVVLNVGGAVVARGALAPQRDAVGCGRTSRCTPRNERKRRRAPDLRRDGAVGHDGARGRSPVDAASHAAARRHRLRIRVDGRRLLAGDRVRQRGGRRHRPTLRSRDGARGSANSLLGFAIAAAAYALAESLPYWPIDVTLPTTVAVALQLDLLRASVVALPAALLWGASFPLALAAAVAAGAEPRRAVGRLYAADTLGAIVGALGTTFVLVVTIGSQRTQQLMILASAAAALAAISTARERGGARRLAAGAAAAVALAVAALTVQPLPPELIAFGRFLPTRGFGANVVYVGEGLTASVAVSAEADGTLTYHNAGKTQASTYPQDMRLQRMLGHLTTLVPERARSVLVIGFGAGITAGAVSIDPDVERVVVAEIEPLVPDGRRRVLRRAQLRRRAQPQGRDPDRRRPAPARDDGRAFRRHHLRPARSVGERRGRALHARVLGALQGAT